MIFHFSTKSFAQIKDFKQKSSHIIAVNVLVKKKTGSREAEQTNSSLQIIHHYNTKDNPTKTTLEEPTNLVSYSFHNNPKGWLNFVDEHVMVIGNSKRLKPLSISIKTWKRRNKENVERLWCKHILTANHPIGSRHIWYKKISLHGHARISYRQEVTLITAIKWKWVFPVLT